MLYVIILIMLVFAGSVYGADCDEQILVMRGQLTLIHSTLYKLSGARPTTPVLTGTCEQKRVVLAQATYDAQVASEAILRPKRDDRPSTLQCDVYVPRTERAARFCWVKP